MILKSACKFPYFWYRESSGPAKRQKTGFGIYGKTLYFFDPQRAKKPRNFLGFLGRHLFLSTLLVRVFLQHFSKRGPRASPAQRERQSGGLSPIYFPVAAAMLPEMGAAARVGKRRRPGTQPKKRQTQQAPAFSESCGGISDAGAGFLTAFFKNPLKNQGKRAFLKSRFPDFWGPKPIILYTST